MNFTDRYIAKTYPNVMVNDPFTNGNPILIKSHDKSKIRESLNSSTYNSAYSGYSCIYDGSGVKSNLMVSVEGCSIVHDNTVDLYPHSLYTVLSGGKSFVLSGDGFKQHQALLYNKLGTQYSFKNSELFIDNNYAKFGKTRWPYIAADEGDILKLGPKDNNNENDIEFDKTLSNMLYGKREGYGYLGYTYYEDGWGANSISHEMDFASYVANASTAIAVVLRISTYMLDNSHDSYGSQTGCDTYLTYPGLWDGFDAPITKQSKEANPSIPKTLSNAIYVLPYVQGSTNFKILQTRPSTGEGWTYVRGGYKNKEQYPDHYGFSLQVVAAIYKSRS